MIDSWSANSMWPKFTLHLPYFMMKLSYMKCVFLYDTQIQCRKKRVKQLCGGWFSQKRTEQMKRGTEILDSAQKALRKLTFVNRIYNVWLMNDHPSRMIPHAVEFLSIRIILPRTTCQSWHVHLPESHKRGELINEEITTMCLHWIMTCNCRMEALASSLLWWERFSMWMNGI